MSNDAPKIDVGLTDLWMSGWFRGNELYSGFPITADDVVLDAGCGDGGYAAFAGRQGAHVMFCDILPDKVAKTEAQLRQTSARAIEPIVMTSERFPLADATATRVICLEVLEHVDDPALFLSELVRIAKPGALFAISVPHPASEAIQKVVAPEHFVHPFHVRVISPEALEEMARNAGLMIERHGAFGFYGAVQLALYRFIDVDHAQRHQHPIIKAWDETWRLALNAHDGPQIKAKLDQALPSSHVIIARKP